MRVSINEQWLYDAVIDNLEVSERLDSTENYVATVKGILFIGKRFTQNEQEKVITNIHNYLHEYFDMKSKDDPFYIKNFDKSEFRQFVKQKLESE